MAAINSLLYILLSSNITSDPSSTPSTDIKSWHLVESNTFPKLCTDNEVFHICVSSCPDDCYNYRDKHRRCSPFCFPGCTCKKGLVKGPNGDCIVPEQCPEQKCPVDNELFSACDGACQRNCTNWTLNIDCPDECVPGCVCRSGMVRGPDGTCVPTTSCPANSENGQPLSDEPENLNGAVAFPTSCGKNEFLDVCPSPCPDDCLNYQDVDRPCPALPCAPACTCDEGFVRGPDGSCTAPAQCPDSKIFNCTGLERYDKCGTPCEDNCDNYGDEDRSCVQVCVEGCFCPHGYVRGPDGGCLRPFECHQTATTPNANGVWY